MRKNSPRKWLHAILDLLPVIIIPIFALQVRSDNNYQPISITTGGYEYKLKYYTNDVNSYDDLIEGNIYHISCNLGDFQSFRGYIYFDYFELNDLGVYGTYDSSNITVPRIYLTTNEGDEYCGYYMPFTSNNKSYGYQFRSIDIDIVYSSSTILSGTFPISIISSSDVEIYEEVYSDSVTYDNTDVGSQMVYTLYQATNDYFNFNRVFNLNSVWNWINTNMFGGNPPLIAFFVWNVIIYEFIIDILFIFYAFFMFLIDFIDCLLEKPFKKINRG